MTVAVAGTVEHWAREKPDSVAIVEGERNLTYAALNDAADRVAAGLHEHGVRRGDIVVLRTQIRLEWAILSAALGKLGCSLLALNWRLTPPETQYVLSNSGAKVFICDDPDPTLLKPAFAGLNVKLAVSVDVPAEGFVSFDSLLGNAPQPRLSVGDPPLIIYTSGTTGLPKGVILNTREVAKTDRKAAEYLQDVAASRPQKTGDVVLLTLPMHHGAGPAALWGALRLGNRIVLLRRFDPAETLGLIDAHKVTVWTGVPTMYKRIAALSKHELDKHDVSSLRRLGVGAAPVPPFLKDWIDGYFGSDKLSEGYGATETGMITHLAPGMHRVKPGSSGLLHRHVDIRIRDENGADLPDGSVGEIWVRTPATIHQYLNGKPLGPDSLDAEGFFRVGDVGRLDEDGHLFITDRAKDMIISGGVNLYPAEIEAGLLRHPAVLDVAVIGIPDDEFGEQVKAFVELRPGAKASAEEIVEHAMLHLASYKRPKSVEIVAELPRNTMGKLLKRELREPYWKGRERRV
ncbi:MAG: long-chain acyl-CoA synthetase [Rhodospirillaceae bacterium]|jgi:long-chain acyl-CoA synthetase|nr:long-chain acyl-CoA synthetase [Rhodospirillaceae bacterium]